MDVERQLWAPLRTIRCCLASRLQPRPLRWPDPGAPPVTLSVSSTTLFYGIGLTATVSADRAPAADATLRVVATPKPGRSGVQQTQTVAMTRSNYTNLMTTFRLVPGQYRLTITTTSSAVNVSGAVVETVTINAVTVTVTTNPPQAAWPVRHDQDFSVSARVTTPSTGYSGTVALALNGIDAPQTLSLSRNTLNSYNFRTLTPGNYTLTVTSPGATITPSAPISFTVSSPPLVTTITPTVTGDGLSGAGGCQRNADQFRLGHIDAGLRRIAARRPHAYRQSCRREQSGQFGFVQ